MGFSALNVIMDFLRDVKAVSIKVKLRMNKAVLASCNTCSYTESHDLKDVINVLV